MVRLLMNRAAFEEPRVFGLRWGYVEHEIITRPTHPLRRRTVRCRCAS